MTRRGKPLQRILDPRQEERLADEAHD
jgi:hypothetical protein